jgi:transitional endoplasmic reticulum ATPase
MYVGESERAIREVFRKARQSAPCIVFFDEIDTLAPPRSGGSQQASERIVGQLLTEIDGIEGLQGVVVVAATNRVDLVDSALLRPGRFDVLVELPLPDLDARIAIFGVHTRNMPLADDVDVVDLAAASAECSGAEIEAVCRHAALLALRELIDDRLGQPNVHEAPGPDLSNLQVGSHHFNAALQEVLAQRQDL